MGKIIIEHQHSLWMARNQQIPHPRPSRKPQVIKAHPTTTEEKTHIIPKPRKKANDKFHKERRATLRKQTTLQNFFKTTPKEKKGDTHIIPLPSIEQQENSPHKPDTIQHRNKLIPKQPKNKTKPRKQTHPNTTRQTLITTKRPPETKSTKRKQTETTESLKPKPTDKSQSTLHATHHKKKQRTQRKTKLRKQTHPNATQQTQIPLTSPPETKNAKRRQTETTEPTKPKPADTSQPPLHHPIHHKKKQRATLKPRQPKSKPTISKPHNKRKQPDPTTAPIQEHNSTPRPKKQRQEPTNQDAPT